MSLIQLTTAIAFIFGYTQALAQSMDMDIVSVPCKDNIKCHDGKPHYMCMAPAPSCHPFKLLNISECEIHSFLLSHNGIRNRVALQYHIANMNIVHWSVKLQQRAELFLRKCQRTPDQCQDVGPLSSQTNGNSYFHHGMINKHWPAHLVRQWFNEFGYKESWKDFDQRRAGGKVGNYSHLIYPLVQFIGCNGALVPSGYLFACYYSPRSNKNYKEAFQFGKPCSQCNPRLPACSRLFHGLCGVDIEVQESKAMVILRGSFQKLIGSLLLPFLFKWLFWHGEMFDLRIVVIG